MKTFLFVACVATLAGAMTARTFSAATDRQNSDTTVDRQTSNAEQVTVVRKSEKKKSKKPKKNSQPGQKKLAVKAFMRGKLDATKQVLEGLVTENYDLIQRGSDKMRVMSMRAEWNVVQGPIYGQYSASFRRSAELIAKAAKEKNVDGASLVFLQLTMNCVNCHKFTRENQGIKVPEVKFTR